VLGLVLALALAVLDQNRWQPWAYQYTLMVVALLLGSGQREDGIASGRRCVPSACAR
jgi:hypothetical protein